MSKNGLRKISAVILGCGNRGQVYAEYSLHTPNELEIVAVIDINPRVLESARVKYGLSEQRAFRSLDAFLEFFSADFAAFFASSSAAFAFLSRSSGLT